MDMGSPDDCGQHNSLGRSPELCKTEESEPSG